MMRPIRAFAATLTALAFITGSVAVPAYAGQKHYQGKGHGYNHGYNQGYKQGAHRGYKRGKHHGYKHSYYNGQKRHYRKHKRHYRKHHRGYYGGYYGYQGGYHGGHHGHHRRGLGKTGAAVLGVGLGLATAAIISNSRRDRDYNNQVYVAPQSARPLAEPAYNPNIARAQTQGFDNCLQTREYQSIVIIGGREQEAYGTACLQPDGSWLRGPAQIAPQY